MDLGSSYRCPRKATHITTDARLWCADHYVDPSAVRIGRAVVQGLGPEAPTVTHQSGAKESHAPYAFTSIDPVALFRVAQIQRGGDDKYGRDNWRALPVDTHLNHALSHIFAYLAGDETDDHLGHAAVRALFALSGHLRPNYHGTYDAGRGAPDGSAQPDAGADHHGDSSTGH